jgi:hypothetical protein
MPHTIAIHLSQLQYVSLPDSSVSSFPIALAILYRPGKLRAQAAAELEMEHYSPTQAPQFEGDSWTDWGKLEG